MEMKYHVALITKKTVIFPHSAGRHMHYSFTATEAVNLFGGEFVP